LQRPPRSLILSLALLVGSKASFGLFWAVLGVFRVFYVRRPFWGDFGCPRGGPDLDPILGHFELLCRIIGHFSISVRKWVQGPFWAILVKKFKGQFTDTSPHLVHFRTNCKGPPRRPGFLPKFERNSFNEKTRFLEFFAVFRSGFPPISGFGRFQGVLGLNWPF